MLRQVATRITKWHKRLSALALISTQSACWMLLFSHSRVKPAVAEWMRSFTTSLQETTRQWWIHVCSFMDSYISLSVTCDTAGQHCPIGIELPSLVASTRRLTLTQMARRKWSIADPKTKQDKRITESLAIPWGSLEYQGGLCVENWATPSKCGQTCSWVRKHVAKGYDELSMVESRQFTNL